MRALRYVLTLTLIYYSSASHWTMMACLLLMAVFCEKAGAEIARLIAINDMLRVNIERLMEIMEEREKWQKEHSK